LTVTFTRRLAHLMCGLKAWFLEGRGESCRTANGASPEIFGLAVADIELPVLTLSHCGIRPRRYG
jgi:hypothetical protein